MKKPRMKIAFIGGGINSAVGETHKIASQMDGRFILSAGCFSRHADINRKTAETRGVDDARVYPDWRELLRNEKDRIDAVVVLTPTDNHTDIVIESIKSGYPVICEKALTTSSREALRIKEALEKNKGYLAVTYNYTGYPMLRELKSMVGKGCLGKIHQIHMEMPQEGYAKLDKKGNPMIPQQWRLRDADLPTISLDLGVHIHNIIDFLTGADPIEVAAIHNSFGAFHQVIDNTLCIANYSGDMVCSIWYSKSAIGHRNGLRVRIYGNTGSAEWYQMEPEILLFSDNKGNRTIIDRANTAVETAAESRYNRFKAGHPAGFIEAFANYYCDIADSLENYLKGNDFRSGYVFTADSAIKGLMMLEAIAESAVSGKFVKADNSHAKN